MYTTLVVALGVLATVSSKDITQGQSIGGRKIFDGNKEASPAIWRQEQNVTINATDNEVISRVVVTDLRPEKDGDAKIVEGGEGQNNVTIELKSPTVLRGFSFHIEVYAVPAEHYNAGKALIDPPAPRFKETAELKPTEQDKGAGSLRINIREPDVDMPDSVEREAPARLPVALTTDFKVNNDARKTRSADDKKTNEDQTKHDKEQKQNPTASGHDNITTTTAKIDLKKVEDSAKDLLEMGGKVPQPVLPEIKQDKTVAIPSEVTEEKKSEHRHARDAENKTPVGVKTIASDASVKDDKDSDEIHEPRQIGDFSIYPRKEADHTSSTTEKNNKEGKDNVHTHSSHNEHNLKHTTFKSDDKTTTEKPRIARDTDKENKSNENEDKTQKDGANIHKIPNRHVAIPVVTPSEEKTTPRGEIAQRIGLENEEIHKMPVVPNVPIAVALNPSSSTTKAPTTANLDLKDAKTSSLVVTTPKISITTPSDKKSVTPVASAH